MSMTKWEAARLIVSRDPLKCNIEDVLICDGIDCSDCPDCQGEPMDNIEIKRMAQDFLDKFPEPAK